MPKSLLALIAILAVASVSEAQATGAAYAAGAHRYRVTRESRSSQEMMGNVQTSTITTYEEFTLDLRQGGRDTMRFTFTIDSATRQSDMPGAGEAPPPKGHRLSGRLSPRGVVHDFDRDSAGIDAVGTAYRNFLPHLPPQPLAAGVTWVDSVRTPVNQGGIQGTSLTVVTSRVLGDTTIANEKAWRIERSAALSMTGTGHQDGADLFLSGTGTANGVSLIAANGVYLGARAEQEISINVEVPAANMTIPIRQTTVTRVERTGAPARR